MSKGEGPHGLVSLSAYRRARNTLCGFDAPPQTAQTGSRIILAPVRSQGVCRRGRVESTSIGTAGGELMTRCFPNPSVW